MLRSCRLALAATVLLVFPAAGHAQDAAPSPVKLARAIRLAGPAPRVDGVLDDVMWATAPIVSDFVQKIPIEGATPSVLMEVRLLYDDGALYVGARLHRKDPSAIRTSITRRDGDSDAETFTVSLDSYPDRRTAYSFSVSSGGVRGDAYHSQDSEDSGREAQFDPISSARAQGDAQGWTAEVRIPFSQLRFNAGARQTWGVQLTRNVSAIAERVQWTLIPIAAAGYSSRFGRLEGIEGIPPARRIELLPYAATDLTYRANESRANRYGARAGGDLKVGLGPNLTLDATINPDYGQVEADPAVVNLTAFENVFEERRPFFIEGNELLTGRGQSFIGRPTWFYSRRIGASAHGSARGDFVDIPNKTTIMTAAKVTGRLKSGLSVGALAAVTPREFARTFDIANDSSGRVAVEPPSTFGVLRLQQEFGSQQSNVGLSLTSVRHSLDERRGPRSRASSATAHFFQRPDQRHVRFDPTRPDPTRPDPHVAERRQRLGAFRQECRPLHPGRHPAVGALAGVRDQRRRADEQRRRHRRQRRHRAPRHEAAPVRPSLQLQHRDTGGLELRRRAALLPRLRERVGDAAQLPAAVARRHADRRIAERRPDARWAPHGPRERVPAHDADQQPGQRADQLVAAGDVPARRVRRLDRQHGRDARSVHRRGGRPPSIPRPPASSTRGSTSRPGRAAATRRSGSATSSPLSSAARCRPASGSTTPSRRTSRWRATRSRSRRAGTSPTSASSPRRGARPCAYTVSRQARASSRAPRADSSSAMAPTSSRCRTSTSTGCRSARTSCCAGSGCRAARRFSSGSRAAARATTPRVASSCRATCWMRPARPATTFSWRR